MTVNFKDLAAQKWFGYGLWSAPFWFVGMEPGGEEDPRVYSSWNDLGAADLLDLKEHSEACEDTRWVAGSPPLQSTWKQLIRLMLGYEDKPTGNEDVRAYQRDRLGRSDGSTLLVEVSSVNSESLSVAVPEREAYRDDRIATIRRHLVERSPELVIFYGLSYRDEYARIAGGEFDSAGCRWRRIDSMRPRASSGCEAGPARGLVDRKRSRTQTDPVVGALIPPAAPHCVSTRRSLSGT